MSRINHRPDPLALVRHDCGGAISSDGAGLKLDARIKPEVRAASPTEPPPDLPQADIGLLPGNASHALARIEPYGFYVILLLMLIPGAVSMLLSPMVGAARFVIRALTGN